MYLTDNIIVNPFVKDTQCESYFIALISFHKGSRNFVCKPLHEGTLFVLFVQYVNRQYVFKPQKDSSRGHMPVPLLPCNWRCWAFERQKRNPKETTPQFDEQTTHSILTVTLNTNSKIRSWQKKNSHWKMCQMTTSKVTAMFFQACCMHDKNFAF